MLIKPLNLQMKARPLQESNLQERLKGPFQKIFLEETVKGRSIASLHHKPEKFF